MAKPLVKQPLGQSPLRPGSVYLKHLNQEVWNGHGSRFNADLLDGLHGTDLSRENYLYISEIDDLFETTGFEYVKIKEFQIRKRPWAKKTRLDCEIRNLSFFQASTTVRLSAIQGEQTVSDEATTSSPGDWEPKELNVDISSFNDGLLHVKIELKDC